MSSDSDTDDDIQMKKLLEATDTTLLSNSMFQRKKEEAVDHEGIELTGGDTIFKKDLPKSQRYNFEDNENSWTDFNLPESMQNHLAKKFDEILEKHYEFYHVARDNSPQRRTEYNNRVKLLKGDECFVNPYEAFEYDTKGPGKKPKIKKRVVDPTNHNMDKDVFKVVAVDGNYILSRKEVNTWAKKKERKDKVFHYKMASNGILHAEEEINEFTEMRRKNKWNEDKIKKYLKKI